VGTVPRLLEARATMETTDKPSAEDLLKHREWVVRLSRRLVADPDLADDLAQDALVKALLHRSSIRSLKSWFRTVLKNLATETGRATSRRKAREVESESAATDVAPAAAEVVARAATQQQVVEAVLCLREPYRSCVLLRYFDDLRPAKIAKRLGVPVSTVETRIQRGLGALRAELDRYHGGDRRIWLQGVGVLVAHEKAKFSLIGSGSVGSSVMGGVAALALATVGGWAYLRHSPRPEPPTIVAGSDSRAPELEEERSPRPRGPESPGESGEDHRPPPAWPEPETEVVGVFVGPDVDPLEIDASPQTPAAEAPGLTPFSPSKPESPADGSTPRFSDRDIKKLRERFAEYFRARKNREYQALTVSYEALKKTLDKVAERSGVTTLLEYPQVMRRVVGAPFEPVASLWRGEYEIHTGSKKLRSGEFLYTYALRVPNTYRAGKPIPLVVSLPDPRRSEEGQLERERARHGFREDALVLVPLSKKNALTSWTSMEGRMIACFAMLDLQPSYDIDRTQVMLSGAPEVTGDVEELVASYPGNFSAVHFAEDSTNHLRGTLALSSSATGKGEDGLKGNARYVRVYRSSNPKVPANGPAMPAEEKVIAPSVVELETSSLEIANAYWVHLTHFRASEENPAKIRAELDKAANQITITALSNVKTLTFYVNDALLDLDRPIVVRRSGDPLAPPLFQGMCERSLDRMLTLWFENRSGNLGETYVNWIEIEFQ